MCMDLTLLVDLTFDIITGASEWFLQFRHVIQHRYEPANHLSCIERIWHAVECDERAVGSLARRFPLGKVDSEVLFAVSVKGGNDVTDGLFRRWKDVRRQ